MRESPTAGRQALAGAERRGAYGFRLAGFGADSPLLGPAPPEWPTLELAVRQAAVSAGDGAVPTPDDEALVTYEDHRAEITLGADGKILVSRSPLRAEFVLPRPLSEHELLHPHLGGVAAVAGRWLGRDAVHAGAFVLGGDTWAVLGGRTAGKSSLLAWLALHDVPVVGDDVLLLDRGRALPAPRFVDLREDAAARLEAGEALGRVGARDRWRMPLPAAVPVLPLRGWILLGWGEELGLHSVPPARRLLNIAPQLTVGAPPPDPVSLIELAALPMVEFRRPRDWDSVSPAGAFLLDRLGELGA